MINLGSQARELWPAVALRSALLFLLWLILTLGKPADIPVGILATVAGTWVSLKLLPPAASRLSVRDTTTFVLHFLYQSIVAGLDVAWRALNPSMPLRPGYVVYASQLPSGTERSAFCTIASLLPGTLPAESSGGGDILIHCLDTGQPIVAQLTEDESLFTRALRGKPRR